MLLDRIEKDFVEAMKAHDAGRVSVLRLLRAAIKNAAIAARTSAKESLDDAAVETVVRQEVKKIKDALVDFEKAARRDLSESAKNEIDVLKSYLPKEIDLKTINEIIDATIERLKQEGVSDFGKVMGAVMREVKGRADGETVTQAVRKALQK